VSGGSLPAATVRSFVRPYAESPRARHQSGISPPMSMVDGYGGCCVES
jgi:hypothetical protein